jgi:hypothetical protein
MDAGTAVGVISLGFNVVEGLLYYCGAWGTYYEDTDSMKQNLEHFTSILQSIDRYLSRSTGVPVYKTRVEEIVISCLENIKKLDAMLKKCRTYQATQNAKERAKAIAQRWTYPFRENALRDMMNTISELKENLTIALLVMAL